MRQVVKTGIVIVLPILLGLILIMLIALPYVLKNYINEHGKEYTGRKIFVKDIKINYFSSDFTILDFKLLEADGQSVFASFDSLRINISPFPLLSSRFEVNQVRLVKPFVNVVRKDVLFNFDDILVFLNSKPKAPPTKKSSSPFKYVIKNISMEQGKLIFADKTVDHTTTLNDLKFFIPYLGFNQEEVKDAGVKFHFENGGFLEAKTNFNQVSLAYQADFHLDKLDLSPFLPYVKSYFRISGLNGLVGGDFHVSGKGTNMDSILVRGKGQVSEFQAKDIANRKVIGAKLATVSIRDSYPMLFKFQFDALKLTEPYLFVEMKDSTINMLNLMVESPADTVPFNYSYRISQLKIEDGILDLKDNSYEEPFNYHLSEIAMNVDTLSSESKWVKMYSTMRLNQRGKLTAGLGINPSDPYEISVNYVINNFQLSDLNIYSKHFVGYPFLVGNMYYKGKTEIKRRQLSSENKLIIRNAKLGGKSKGLYNLPLKLALYLLKDIHGDITLDLPLTGDLNNPQTHIGKLVWQVLKNVVVKVVASPFIALSGLLGVEPAEAKGIEFNYADTTLTATHLRRIRMFTDLEKKKPDMKIEISGFNDAGLERNQVALNEAAKMGNGTHAGELRVDSLQQSLNRIRIRKIEDALKSFDPLSKIKVLMSNKEAPENVGSRPVFELKYSIDE